MEHRPFDVVLYGATGFTGRQTARYFADSVGVEGTRWALAGRDEERLHAVRDSLGTVFSAVTPIVADSRDPDSLDRLAAQTRVVLNTAGPFALHGEPVVAACIRNGTDYVDITGETAYVRRLIDTYHDEAARKGVRIVPFCGFDSVPSDIGTLLVVERIRSELGQACTEVKAFFRARGGLNGGTAASLLNMFDSGEAARFRDPFLLDGGAVRGEAERAVNADWLRPHRDPDIGSWVAPFFMAPVNTRVVRRSHALRSAWGEGYGPGFRYREGIEVGVGPTAPAKAAAVAAAMGAFQTMLRSGTFRGLLRKLAPPPGAGPSQATMDSGFFRCKMVGTAGSGDKVRATLSDTGDPGNRVTVKILCESALALAEQRGELPGGEGRGGILTPATALGQVLAERLRRAGMRIEVSREPAREPAAAPDAEAAASHQAC